MASKTESWSRLKHEAWCSNPALAKTNDTTAKFMPLSKGVGPYKSDEYSIEIDSFPTNLSPIAYLKEFAMSPNKAVNSTVFNIANKFKKRAPGRLALGDIWDIDIMGPDNGSIVLVKTSPSLAGGKHLAATSGSSDAWFDIQTIECKKYGTHPECGAREFGFETTLNGIKFYTRGVSRAYIQMHRLGTPIQNQSWKGMLSGIAEELIKRGATIANKTVNIVRN